MGLLKESWASKVRDGLSCDFKLRCQPRNEKVRVDVPPEKGIWDLGLTR